MIIHGQVELTCAFGRIGCLLGQLHAGVPFRHVEFPIGSRWYEGAEYMRLRGISKVKAGRGWCSKPDWVVELPPDWEVIALWENDDTGFFHGELWADYGDHRDLSGLLLRELDDQFEDEEYDWWDDWFSLPGDLESESNTFAKNGVHEWDFDRWWEIYDALHLAGRILKRGLIPETNGLGMKIRDIMLTKHVRAKIEAWRERLKKRWAENPYATDIETYDWADLCGWCADKFDYSDAHPTMNGLHICKSCGQEYEEELAEVYNGAEEIAKETGRPFQKVLYRPPIED